MSSSDETQLSLYFVYKCFKIINKIYTIILTLKEKQSILAVEHAGSNFFTIKICLLNGLVKVLL